MESNRKIVDFAIVSASDANDMRDHIMVRIKQGWELRGGIVLNVTSDICLYTQAMVMYEERHHIAPDDFNYKFLVLRNKFQDCLIKYIASGCYTICDFELEMNAFFSDFFEKNNFDIQ